MKIAFRVRGEKTKWLVNSIIRGEILKQGYPLLCELHMSIKLSSLHFIIPSVKRSIEYEGFHAQKSQ